MNEIELHHLRCLVTLAEELNFGRAAVRLHMSQPPLTRIVSEVERVIGSRLFERTTRRVKLTPVGELFVTEAQAVLSRMEVAMDSVRGAVRQQSGQLRVAYVPLALMTVLPRVVSGLREREHDVCVDMTELSGEALKEAVRSGHVDIGFADEPCERDGLENMLLHQEPLSVMLPSDHRLVCKDNLVLVDLAEETIILHPRHEYPRYHDRITGAFKQSGFAPNIYYREARQNCLALVVAGQGLLLGPARSSNAFAGGLKCLPLKETPTDLRTEVWVVLPTAPGSPHLEALRGVIRDMVAARGSLSLP